jgi:hypothetical protein
MPRTQNPASWYPRAAPPAPEKRSRRAGFPQFPPQAGHFRSESLHLGVVFVAVLGPGNEAQIEQPIVLFVSVDVVDKFGRQEASSETLGDDEAVFIDPAPLVCHRQVRTVQRDNY